MKIHQIAVFLQNQPGHLSGICRALAEASINIVTLSLADTQQFGILRLIVREWERAVEVLERAGFLVQIREVVATEVPDRPGGMAEVLDVVCQAGVNIEYVYAFAFRSRERAVLVFRFDNADHAITVLREAGHNVLGTVELFDEEA